MEWATEAVLRSGAVTKKIEAAESNGSPKWHAGQIRVIR
jgi:hypothetical protein